MLCLTSRALRTTFLWRGAGVERGIALELCSGGQLWLVINIFPMIVECGASYILLMHVRCNLLWDRFFVGWMMFYWEYSLASFAIIDWIAVVEHELPIKSDCIILLIPMTNGLKIWSSLTWIQSKLKMNYVTYITFCTVKMANGASVNPKI